jgi:glycosyltransferase involved in cell wall biosynthesis
VAEQARALGVPDERLSVVRNAVEVGEFEMHPPTGRDVVFVGRLVRNNGPREFLQAAARVVDDHPDAHVHVVGTGPLAEPLVERAAELGIADAVTFHGFVDDIRTAYELADVFCRPSYSEGLPLTVLESMASGVPPVVSDIAGVPEVVDDGETGLLLPVGDTDALVDSLSACLADPDRLATMGRNARDYAERELSWADRVRKVISVYESTLDP